MTDTIRETIIGNIVDALASIRTSGGYQTDAGRLVRRGQWITDSDQLPALAVMPLEELNTPVPGRHNLVMRVRVDGVYQYYQQQNPSVMAEKLLGDIIKRMSSPALSSVHGGYAEKVQYVEGGVEEYPEPGQKTIHVYAVFDVAYKTNLGDPYNQ